MWRAVAVCAIKRMSYKYNFSTSSSVYYLDGWEVGMGNGKEMGMEIVSTPSPRR